MITTNVTKTQEKDELKIFALGGLYEVGKNMYCFEYKDELIIVDAGILFPDDDLFGIDYIIPNFDYLKENESKIKGLFITHGHEDHICGIPYLLKQVKIPRIYANGLAVELIKKKLEDNNIKMHVYSMDELETIKYRYFSVSLFRIMHSIPDAFGIVIDTPYGTIVETGDFKFDFTPIGKDANYQKICSLGEKGILLLMSDSTNSKVKELSSSEKVVAENIKDLFREVKGRVIIATFASNVNRISQIVESSIEEGRKVCVVGRSMEHIIQIGREQRYINASDENFITDKELSMYPNNEITILCTGTQGEPMAALTRIANGMHKQIKIVKDDTIVFSSSAIPGNSTGIDVVINQLCKQNANVIVQSTFNDVHSSGHASSNEQKLMLKLLRPKYFMPMHGEYYMLKTHAKAAIDCGVDPKNVFVLQNGNILSISEKGARVLSKKIDARDVLIDGTDIGGVNSQIIEERRTLSQRGMVSIVVFLNDAGKVSMRPTVISKGFLFAKDNEAIFRGIENYVIDFFKNNSFDSKEHAEEGLENSVFNFISTETKHRPLIFAVVKKLNWAHK